METVNETLITEGLNAPYGARCFLTVTYESFDGEMVDESLNAPYGARCFLT